MGGKDRGGVFLSMSFHEPIMEHLVARRACDCGTINSSSAGVGSTVIAAGETHRVRVRHQTPQTNASFVNPMHLYHMHSLKILCSFPI